MKKAPAAALFEEGPEEDEEKDDRHDDAYGDAEDAFRRDVHLVEDPVDVVSPVAEAAGDEIAEIGVEEKQARHDRQGPADGAPRGIEDHDDAQTCQDLVEHREIAHPVDEVLEVPDDVAADHDGKPRPEPVDPGQGLCLREKGIGHEDDEEAQHEDGGPLDHRRQGKVKHGGDDEQRDAGAGHADEALQKPVALVEGRRLLLGAEDLVGDFRGVCHGVSFRA